MIVTGFWPVFLLGCVGGMMIEILRWWKIREEPLRPAYYSSPFYWMITVLMILTGGGLATLYGVEQVHAIAVANLGASAPALMAVLAKPRNSDVSERQLGTEVRSPSAPPTWDRLRSFLSFR